MSEALFWTRFASALAARQLSAGSRQVAERLRRDQTGQDLVEYGGILILVAAIITALFAIGIPGDISSFVSTAVNNIVGSGASASANGSSH